jgi:hypothetical protein
LDEDATDDAGIIGAAEVQDGVGDDADFFMGVEQGEGRLGHGIKGQFFVSTFYTVFYGVGQKIELASQMGEKGLVDLRKFQFPLRERANDFVGDGWRNSRGTTVQKFHNLRHDGNLPETLEEAKTILWAKNPVALTGN